MIGGDALDGPRYITWNFVSSRRERILEAGADWAAQRIKGLSLSKAARNALWPQPRAPKSESDRVTQIKTLITSFRYPRLGPGMLWEAAAEKERREATMREPEAATPSAAPAAEQARPWEARRQALEAVEARMARAVSVSGACVLSRGRKREKKRSVYPGMVSLSLPVPLSAPPLQARWSSPRPCLHQIWPPTRPSPSCPTAAWPQPSLLTEKCLSSPDRV